MLKKKTHSSPQWLILNKGYCDYKTYSAPYMFNPFIAFAKQLMLSKGGESYIIQHFSCLEANKETEFESKAKGFESIF